MRRCSNPAARTSVCTTANSWARRSNRATTVVSMLIAEDLLLLATDDVSGKLLRSSSYVDVALGGALLVELVLADRVRLDGSGWRARAAVIDNRPLADPTLNAALARLVEKPPARPTAVVNRLAKGARKALYAGMAARGIVTAVEHQVLGIFPSVRWPATNPRYEDQLRSVLRDILLGVREPTPAEGALVSILAGANMLKVIVPADQFKAAKARAKVLSQGNWASEAVRQSIAATQAATTAALTATIAASTSSGS